MPGVRIILFLIKSDRTYKQAGTTISSSDGMYFFKDVAPGKYVIQVAGSNYPVEVIKTATQDLQPVVVEY
jgi:hypothetical protein